MAADSGLLTILVLLDLTAAFDTVSHEILLDRLVSIGITGTPLSWFRSYLSGRTQRIQLKRFRSRTSTVTTGFPQGSVLGPGSFYYLYSGSQDAPRMAAVLRAPGKLCSFRMFY